METFDTKSDVQTIVPCAADLADRRSVLVVDDDPLLRRVIGRVLRSSDFDVTVVDNGAAAVEAIRARSFDTVLSDIHMPGMSGVALLREVRGYDETLPVILMTGHAEVATAIEAVSGGAEQYLLKPTSNDVLLAAVDRATTLHRVKEADHRAAIAKIRARAELDCRLSRGLQSMWMAFQPIVDASSGRVAAYEALVRSKEAGLTGAAAILENAEQLARLPELGRRVRSLAAEAFARADEDALLFVNLHPQDLLDPDLLRADSPLGKIAPQVVLEITERSAIENLDEVKRRLRVLRDRGFRVAIDDLGAGYAGLASFAAIEPDFVKLDMSLIRDIHRSKLRQQLVASVTSTCKAFGIRVVAEGIETADEHDCVRTLGCDLLQGYLFGRPGALRPHERA